MAVVKVPVYGAPLKAVFIDTEVGARVDALAAQVAQLSAVNGGNIQHSSLQGLQIGDDHPQYTMWQAPETIKALWNFEQEPDIEGISLTEFIEDVVGGELVEDSTSISWTYNDSANTLQAHVIDEYVQDLVGAMLVDTSTVDFTYDDTAGTFSAAVPGAALTKVDDTNVTLTLGGSPTTALARAASLTLGWTGQLAVSRGGSGASTLTGYLKGNGTSAFTASATIPYSDISGTPTIPMGANPTASVGLTAVNGVASTFMRSDGAPALSQSISPTWTGNHIFTGSFAWSSIQPEAFWVETDAAANSGTWAAYVQSGVWALSALSDNLVTESPALKITRSTTTLQTYQLPQDNFELQLGAGQDLRLYHNGTNSYVRNDTGSLVLNMSGTDIWSMTQTGTVTHLTNDATPLTVNGTNNGAYTMVFDNDSNGTGNACRIVFNSGDASAAFFTAGSGRTSSVLTGGPTGAQSVIRTLGAYPLIFGTNNTAQVQVPSDGGIALVDGITAPATLSGWAKIYVDTADGDLKIKFGDGTVKTIVVDT